MIKSYPYLIILALGFAMGLTSCSDDSDANSLHYVEGTTYVYDAKVKSTTYEPFQYTYPNPNKPQGRGVFTYNDNTYSFEVDFSGNVKVTEAIELKNQVAVIPAYIDEKTVTTIGEKLFYSNKDLTIIVMPCTIINLLDNCIVATNANVYMPSKAYSLNNNAVNKNIIIYKIK